MAICGARQADGRRCTAKVALEGDRCRRHRYRCRAPTADGSPCQNSVPNEDARCRHHLGSSTVAGSGRRRGPDSKQQQKAQQPASLYSSATTRRRRRAAKRPPSKSQQRRIEQAVEYCSDVLTKGAVKTIEDRIIDYVTDQTWKQFAARWEIARCEALASFAQEILAGNAKIHHEIGEVGAWLMEQIQELLPFNFGRRTEALQRALARKLFEALPVPGITEHLVTVGRGLQITGIVLCVLQDYDLRQCACFEDLVNEQGKQFTRQLIQIAMGDWKDLGEWQVES